MPPVSTCRKSNSTPLTGPPCPKCGVSYVRLLWTRFKNGTLHLREECSACRSFRRWAPQTAAAVAAADRDTTDRTRYQLLAEEYDHAVAAPEVPL